MTEASNSRGSGLLRLKGGLLAGVLTLAEGLVAQRQIGAGAHQLRIVLGLFAQRLIEHGLIRPRIDLGDGVAGFDLPGLPSLNSTLQVEGAIHLGI